MLETVERALVPGSPPGGPCLVVPLAAKSDTCSFGAGSLSRRLGGRRARRGWLSLRSRCSWPIPSSRRWRRSRRHCSIRSLSSRMPASSHANGSVPSRCSSRRCSAPRASYSPRCARPLVDIYFCRHRSTLTAPPPRSRVAQGHDPLRLPALLTQCDSRAHHKAGRLRRVPTMRHRLSPIAARDPGARTTRATLGALRDPAACRPGEHERTLTL